MDNCLVIPQAMRVTIMRSIHYGYPGLGMGCDIRSRRQPKNAICEQCILHFCKHFGIKHISCPVRDHRGNGKKRDVAKPSNEQNRAFSKIE